MTKNKQSNENNPKINWKVILILAVSVFAFYGNSIKNGFSMDDDLVTKTDRQNHPRVEKGIAGIPEILRTHYVENAKQKYAYRPVTTISFAIEYQFFGSKSNEVRAHISHFINVVLYLLIAILIYNLSIKLLGDENNIAAIFIALLFIIHPIHTEVVDNIKSRDELLVLIFGLLSIFSFIKYIDSNYVNWKQIIFGFIFLVLSIMSKRSGLVFIAVIPLTIYFFRDIKLKHIGYYFAVVVSLFLVFKLLAISGGGNSVVREKMFFENPLYYESSLSLRISMFFYSMIYYLGLMFFPHPLRYYYGYDQVPIATFSDPFVWVGLIVVVGLTLLSILNLKKKPIWAFGVLFYFFGIGGAANLLFPAVGIIAERFTFTASLGLIFIGGYYASIFIEQVKWNKNIKVSILGAVVLVSLLTVVGRNNVWNSQYSLYKHDIQYLEKSAKAHSLLGTEYKTISDSLSRTGQITLDQYLSYTDSIIDEYNKALEVYPDYFNCSNNAGVMYFSRKQNPFKSKEYFRMAIDSRPDYVEALFNYGNCIEVEYNIRLEIEKLVEPYLSDSISFYENKESVLDSALLKSAYFSLFAKQRFVMALKNQNFNNANWPDLVIKSYIPYLKQGLKVENGLFLNEIGSDQIVKDLKLIINHDKADPNIVMQNAINYFSLVAYDLIKKTDGFKPNTIYQHVVDRKDALKDSMVIYWDSAYRLNPDYVYAINKLSEVYRTNEMYNELLEISNFAINNSALIKTNFYLNIASVYKIQGDLDKAINKMIEASAYLADEQNKVMNSSVSEKEKNERLLNLSQQSKQIYGFLASLYMEKGDLDKAGYYQKLQNSN